MLSYCYYDATEMFLDEMIKEGITWHSNYKSAFIAKQKKHPVSQTLYWIQQDL